MPPPPRPDGDEPDAKRQRTDFVLQPEDEFLERHPGAARVRVQVGFWVQTCQGQLSALSSPVSCVTAVQPSLCLCLTMFVNMRAGSGC